MSKKIGAVNALTADEVKTELRTIDAELATINARKIELEARRKILVTGAREALLGFQQILAETEELPALEGSQGKSINELNLTVRPHNRLHGAGFRFVEDLLKARRDELLAIPYLGRKCLGEIIYALEEHGFNADHLKNPKP